MVGVGEEQEWNINLNPLQFQEPEIMPGVID